MGIERRNGSLIRKGRKLDYKRVDKVEGKVYGGGATNTTTLTGSINQRLDPFLAFVQGNLTMPCPGDSVTSKMSPLDHALAHCARCDDTGRVPRSPAETEEASPSEKK